MASTSAQTTAKDNIIVRKEEVLFRLGESSFLSVNSYRGLIKIHIRWFQELSSGRLYPTTNLITLSPDEFQQLLKFSGKIEASVRVLEKKKKPAPLPQLPPRPTARAAAAAAAAAAATAVAKKPRPTPVDSG